MKKNQKGGNKMSDDSKTYAFLGVFLPIVGYIILKLSKKEDKYSLYYAKQGLILGIAWIIVSVLVTILGLFMHFYGLWTISMILNLALLLLWILGIVYSLSGEMKAIPLIGTFVKQI